MSRTFHHGERRIKVRSIRKDNPDSKRVARVVIAYARAQAEAAAAAEAKRATRSTAKNGHTLPPSETKKGDAA